MNPPAPVIRTVIFLLQSDQKALCNGSADNRIFLMPTLDSVQVPAKALHNLQRWVEGTHFLRQAVYVRRITSWDRFGLLLRTDLLSGCPTKGYSHFPQQTVPSRLQIASGAPCLELN